MIELYKPIEVTEKQYREARNRLSGIVAHRQENGKYYLKLMFNKYSYDLELILK